MRFGLEGGKSVILDRVQATTDGPIILKQHAITFDRSSDLQRATNNNVTAEQPGMPPFCNVLYHVATISPFVSKNVRKLKYLVAPFALDVCDMIISKQLPCDILG